jgi:hypothetical protein
VTRPVFRLELEALPTSGDPDRRLAMLLKYALRSCALKCRSAVLVEPEPAASPTPSEEGSQ